MLLLTEATGWRGRLLKPLLVGGSRRRSREQVYIRIGMGKERLCQDSVVEVPRSTFGTYGRVLVVSTLLAVIAGLPCAGQSISPQSRPCAARRPVTVSERFIGPLDLDRPLGELLQVCTFAHDTSLPNESPGSRDYPGLSFPFADLTVMAVQYG
jgi:hypothetical protein